MVILDLEVVPYRGHLPDLLGSTLPTQANDGSTIIHSGSNEIINEFDLGGDLVIGQRDFSKMPFPRNYSNTIGTWLFSWALGRKCPDNQSGYRLHSRRMIEAAINSTELNFEFEVEIIVRCVSLGYALRWVPIQTIYAGEKSHIQPLRHIRHFFRLVVKTRRMIKQAG